MDAVGHDVRAAELLDHLAVERLHHLEHAAARQAQVAHAVQLLRALLRRAHLALAQHSELEPIPGGHTSTPSEITDIPHARHIFVERLSIFVVEFKYG